jgi:hypothetical protein
MTMVRIIFILGLLGSVSTSEAHHADTTRITIRISPASPLETQRLAIRNWKEKGAPKCLRLGDVHAMMITHADSLDLAMRDGKFFRAKLEKGCPSANFYAGIYLQPTEDGRLCEDRDSIQPRTGGACEIKKFNALKPPK